MTFCASPNYCKARAERLKRRAMQGVAAREKLRLERAAECGQWTSRTIILQASFSPDGRFVGLQFANGEWARCGSERYVRGQLAKKLWNMKGK